MALPSVDQALALILERIVPGPAETVPLAEALGRILKEAATADADEPPFAKSAMDGYAIAEGDASPEFRLIGVAEPGRMPDCRVEPGTCVRIFTGAPLPEGAGRVVVQEVAEVTGDRVRFRDLAGPSYIRPRGQDYQQGDRLLDAETRLNAAALGILATAGIARPRVAVRPRIAHLTTGNELADPSEIPGPGQIRDSNSALVAGLVAEAGAALTLQKRLGDDPDLLFAETAAAAEASDFLLISGGAGGGDHDHAREALERAGFAIHLAGVDIRPGRPLLFATRGEGASFRAAFGLPGNPLSHHVTFQVFVRRAIEARMEAHPTEEIVAGILDRPLPGMRNPRDTFWPCRWRGEGGRLCVRPLDWTSSNHLASLREANGYLRIEPVSELHEGEIVCVHRWP
jgi:molybdopterin molybdotransferase